MEVRVSEDEFVRVITNESGRGSVMAWVSLSLQVSVCEWVSASVWISHCVRDLVSEYDRGKWVRDGRREGLGEGDWVTKWVIVEEEDGLVSNRVNVNKWVSKLVTEGVTAWLTGWFKE